MMHLGVLGVLAVGLVLGCGNGGSRPGAERPQEKRAPVKRDALREFDAGLRALRLGGPEAGERAAERFAEAVKLDPQLWEAWHNLGVIYSREGDEGAALDAFDEALKINSDHTPSLLARAESARKLGRLAQARKDYQRAVEREPTDPATRLRLASLLREAGDLDGSLEAVREVLRQNPSEARAYVELGLMHLAGGRDELADLVLVKASEMDPKNPLVWNALALLNLKRGRDQEAFLQFDHASSLDPSFRDARFNKASVLLDARRSSSRMSYKVMKKTSRRASLWVWHIEGWPSTIELPAPGSPS
jgi:tetratricopeptide (TPR) repeat protein